MPAQRKLKTIDLARKTKYANTYKWKFYLFEVENLSFYPFSLGQKEMHPFLLSAFVFGKQTCLVEKGDWF